MSFRVLSQAFHDLFMEAKVDNPKETNDLQPPGPTVSPETPEETLEKFAADLEAQGYAARTIQGYVFYGRHFIRWMADRAADFRDLRPDHLREYQGVVAARPGRRGQGLSAASRLGIAVALSQLARFVSRTGRGAPDLAAAIALPSMPRKLPDNILSMKEMERLLSMPDISDPAGLRDRALMELLYATGLRQTEALDLGLEDVDLAAGEARVRRGKGGAGRMVPLGREAVAALAAYLAEARPALTRAGDSGHLFVSRSGTRVDPSGMLKAFKRYAKKAGIRRSVGFHTFRHAVATHLMQRGAHLRYIQELLGHKSLGSTQIYTRVTISDLKRAHARYHPRERMDV